MNRKFEGLHLSSIELFCLVADHSGFSPAANHAGLTAAAVSRSIARLEARLGVRLFHRTTRQVRLTSAGERYRAECQRALDVLAEAEREVTGGQTQPSGKLRISLPTSYGHYRILPLIGQLRSRYPQISLDLHLSNQNIDFVADNFDLAVRARIPPDSGLIARKLEDAPLVIVAAPQYLQGRDAPTTPADLHQHECIQFVLPSSGLPVPWLLKHGKQTFEHIVPTGLQCHEDILGPVTLARNAAGITQTYRFLVDDDLRAGRLVELLPDYAGASRPFSLIYSANRHMPLRMRVVIDFLLEKLGAA
ncbi:LysR family transcriptional regulator [Bordetella trematum]|uniref:LysR family transcriptional regulator n=1 Tax=Bordetella trematum TaxID=123899 RepID=UPI00079AB3C7|nr:LysR family transcriptional regulator [Bordetella trematum]AUL45887.1 LysR family transcriptional regulator [Bordetella trematum]SAI61870.1 LysR family transcriptional regulator [Bordetella trematum]